LGGDAAGEQFRGERWVGGQPECVAHGQEELHRDRQLVGNGVAMPAGQDLHLPREQDADRVGPGRLVRGEFKPVAGQALRIRLEPGGGLRKANTLFAPQPAEEVGLHRVQVRNGRLKAGGLVGGQGSVHPRGELVSRETGGGPDGGLQKGDAEGVAHIPDRRDLG